MVHLALGISKEEASLRARDTLENGRAFEKFKEWITAQGGDAHYLDNPEKLPKAPHKADFTANTDGFISAMDTEKIGLASVVLGAGRKEKSDRIDPSAGIVFKKKTGDRVKFGEVIAVLYSSDNERLALGIEELSSAISVTENQPPSLPLIISTVN